MWGQVFSSLGSIAGKAAGGGILSVIGRFAGRLLGNYLESQNYEEEEYTNFQNIKDSFNLSTAQIGKPISLIFGYARTKGKIIWASQIKEIQQLTSIRKYFRHSQQTKGIQKNFECEYYLSFALALCEGEITEIGRVWGNDELVDISCYQFRLYHGTEEQLPDPLIASMMGRESTPAFRGLAYIVFDNLPLADFNNMIPNLSFEVLRRPNVKSFTGVEGLVNSIVIIPGCGEFVYDTITQYKIIRDNNNIPITRKVINSHNRLSLPNSLYSLNQLQLICPNIEWIAVVVVWFGDSLDAAACTIKPGIEFNDPNTTII